MFFSCSCGANLFADTQRHGPWFIPKGLLAAIDLGKFSDYVPLYRLEDVFVRSGVELGRSTLCRWARHKAELLKPLHRRLSERVRASHLVHTDDTPVQVLDPAIPLK